MKTLVKACAILLVAGIFCVAPQRAVSQVSVSFQVFYNGLAPYGYWVDYPAYGYVWVPNAGAGFVPYATDGHWVYTDDGWMWVSDYSWGWAPFHYGRWFYDGTYGWMWIPGDDWGPAWVAWRSCDGYYGWAPLGPGVGIGFGYIAPEYWCFVRERYITSPHVYRYYAPRSDNPMYIKRSTVINRTYADNNTHVTYVSGPRREDVEAHTGAHITPVAIHASSAPGQRISGHSISIYRPAFTNRTAHDPHPAPAKVAKLDNLPHRGNAAHSAAQPQHSNAVNRNGNNHVDHTPPHTVNHAQPARHQPAQPMHHQPAQPVHHQPAQPMHHQPAQPMHHQPAQPMHHQAAQPMHHQPAQPMHQQPMHRQQPPQRAQQPMRHEQPHRQAPPEPHPMQHEAGGGHR